MLIKALRDRLQKTSERSSADEHEAAHSARASRSRTQGRNTAHEQIRDQNPG